MQSKKDNQTFDRKQSPKKNRINLSSQLWFLAIGLAAVLIGLIGYWKGINKNKENEQPVPESTEMVVETAHVHDWVSATCSSPEICLSCGETRGTTIAHHWLPATISSPKQCELCGITEGSRILLVGDSVWLGYYEQDGNPNNGKEEIEWVVLEYDADKNQAFVISKYCLDTISFDFNSASWQDSSIRKWLNNDFISSAFSVEERTCLLETKIEIPMDYSEREASTKTITDYIFLLDYEEATKSFVSNAARQGTPTEYCRQRGCYDPERYAYEHNTDCKEVEKGHTWWWLRSEGIDPSRAGNVVSAGTVGTYGGLKNSTEGTIRPAMWIKTA